MSHNTRVMVLVAGFVPALVVPTVHGGRVMGAGPLTLVPISTPFNSPVGIDHHEPSNTVIASVNYFGGQPNNFERIQSDGTHVPFSSVSGLTDEIKIATVRSGNVGGFTTGDLFTGNGVDGQIIRITNNGTTVVDPFVDLPGGGNGLMRGSLYVDRTGVYGGNLIAATTGGEIWRIDAAGTSTFVADVNVHLEGLQTVPNDASKYGPLAGKIIAGAEGVGLLYSFDATGFVSTFNVGVNIEDIDLIPANENFFGVNFGSSRILGAHAADFDGVEGDILLTQELHSGAGLFRLFWDGSALVTQQFSLSASSAVPSQWEHVTFSPAGIVEIPDVPEPAAATLVLSALCGVLRLRRRLA